MTFCYLSAAKLRLFVRICKINQTKRQRYCGFLSVLKMQTFVFLQFERINIHFNYNLKYLMIFLHNWSDKLLCFLSFCCNFAAELEQSVTLT